MSPRNADPQLRTTLVEVAARLLAEEGPAALTSRRLAAEVGSSTMAVYSRFPTMAHLRRAVREEAFAHLDSRLDVVPPSDYPVAGHVAAGTVWFANRGARPH